MKHVSLLALLALAITIPQMAEARFNDRDAKHACKQAARAQYGADGFRNLTSSNRGNNHFKITGIIVLHGRSDAPFHCHVKSGRITELTVKGAPRVSRSSSSSGSGSGNDTNSFGALMGAAIGAAIVGSVSSDHKHDDYRPPSNRPGHGNGWKQSYNPTNNITCYPRQRACYKRNGNFSAKWTQREFGSGSQRPSQGQGIAQRDMQRYCQGEASARFNQNPRNILTLPVERNRNNYVVYGQFPPQGRRVTTFRCTFNASRRFVSVNRT